MGAADVSLWLPFCHLKHVSSEPLKSPLATGEDDNLLVPRLPVQCVEHLLDAVVVRIDQRIIKDDGRWPAIARKQPRKCQPR